MRYFTLTLLFLGLFTTEYLFGGTLIIAKKGAVLYSKPSKKSLAMTKIDPGTKLEADSRNGLYWKVEYMGEDGYVSVLKVTRASGNSTGGISQIIREQAKEGRSNGTDIENSRARSAVMGVRGLDESTTVGSAGSTKPNYRLVYKMEDRVVRKKALVRLEQHILDELQRIASRIEKKNKKKKYKKKKYKKRTKSRKYRSKNFNKSKKQ